MKSVLALALGFGLLALCAMTALAQSSPDAPSAAAAAREAARDVLSGSGYQRELPERGPDDADRPDSSDRLRLPIGLGALAELLLWGLVIAGGVLLAYYLLNMLPRRARERQAAADLGPGPDDVSAALEPEPRDAGSLLDEAEALARQGRYGEAIHALLLYGIAELDRQREIELAPSLTSREILGRLALAEEARQALARLVAFAELDHFGGRTSSEEDYRSCLEDCRRLVAPGSGAA